MDLKGHTNENMKSKYRLHIVIHCLVQYYYNYYVTSFQHTSTAVITHGACFTDRAPGDRTQWHPVHAGCLLHHQEDKSHWWYHSYCQS